MTRQTRQVGERQYFILQQEVKNRKPDRRLKRNISAHESWPAGTQFEIYRATNNVRDSYTDLEYDILYFRDRSFLVNDRVEELLAVAEQVPLPAGVFMESTGLNCKEIVAYLMEHGGLDMEALQDIHVYYDTKEEDRHALELANKFWLDW